MTELLLTACEAARARSAAIVQRSARPSERRASADSSRVLRSPYRAAAAATPSVEARFQVERAATAPEVDVVLRGYASAYEQPFQMWDAFGPYTEVVSQGAGAASLSAGADVKLLFNHRDMPMARRRGLVEDETAGGMVLTEDDHGLLTVARPLMSLAMSQQVVTAIEAGLIDEMSYAFCITRGSWSADYTEYRIYEYDIHRGDTSAVTYGANPFTDIAVERTAPEVTGLAPERKAAARKGLYAHLTR